MKTVIIALRLIITAWLIYMVYTETGFYTAFCLGLITICVELHSFTLQNTNKSLGLISKLLGSK